MDNKKRIDEINAKIKKAGYKWTAAETSMMQLSPDERKRKLGYNPGGDELSLEERNKLSAAGAFRKSTGVAAYPASIDWRNFNGSCYVNPIEDQGQCGSCVSFGVLSTVESAAQIIYNLPGQLPPLSEEQLFFCGNTFPDPCKQGWFVTAALNYVQTPGVLPAEFDPYQAQNAACTFNPDLGMMVTQISGYTTLTDTNAMKTWIATQGPLVTAFTVYQDFYAYAGGVYISNDQNPEGGHCVSVIGYSDTLQAWLCKNSWGTGWGIGGYFWIGYGQCGIDAEMWGVNGVPVVHNPHWTGDTNVSNVGMSDSPSVVMYNNEVYCFHQGGGDDGSLWYNVFDGTNWLGDTNVPNTGMSSSPSAVVYNNQIYCFHQGSGDDGSLWYNVFDGTNWLGDTNVPNTGMSDSPSAIVYNNQIYCFHQGSGDDGSLWYNVFDGTNWLGDTNVPNTGMSSSPSAVVLGGLIWCFHQGGGDNGTLWSNIFTGDGWVGDTNVPNTGMSSSPSAIVFNNQLLCFHQGGGDNGQLWYNTLDLN